MDSHRPNAPSSAICAVDTGGTFTDAVGRRGTRVAVAKVRSTPDDPSRAVATAVAQLREALDVDQVDVLVHGTTVATNALLEQRGAETWLVTNAGFEDLLEIGRQARDDLFAFQPAPRPVLVPRARRVGVGGRISAAGEVLRPLEMDALDAVLRGLDARPRSWAVCLLHAYRDPSHERAVGARIRALRPDDAVSLSSDILPVFREVERASTTTANAFVGPIVSAYVARLGALASRVAVMGSSGGRLPIDAVVERPIATALSGPAGGVVAASAVAASLGSGVVSFDMGGTSTDVALCTGGRLPVRHASRVGPFSIHVPMLDVHTVAAGGGSIARVDAGGALRVGPESAGADPGPACYGVGESATVTDANVVLGRLPADTLLGGHLPVDASRAADAVGRVAASLDVSLERAADGIIRVAVESMAQAIRKISVERGVDPRGLALCAFGGAGGLHACALADVLGMRTVVVPAHAGLLSAVGMLGGAAVAERSRTVLGAGDTGVVAAARSLVDEAVAALGEPVAACRVTLEARYAGQSFELGVPLELDAADAMHAARAAFQRAHDARFGYRMERAVESVTVRVRASGAAPGDALLHEDAAPVRCDGPGVVTRLASTTWIPAGWTARSDALGGLIITREEVS